MIDLISGFPLQIGKAMEIGEKAVMTPGAVPISNIIISGLGGSGIGGSIVVQLAEKESPVPIAVNNTYFLPAYTGPDTLVIISSYSGNTEETISCLEEAIRKGSKIVCVTSGGAIAKLAREYNLDLISIPGGMPPRACLGYSMTQLFYILEYHNIIGKSFRSGLVAAIDLINYEKDMMIVEAKAIAAKIIHKVPVIYSDSSIGSIAVRFRQQVNENAKMLCWHNIFPELNHNELVGWTEKNEQLAVLIFRNKTDFYKNQHRIEISKKIFNRYTSTIIEIYSKGGSDIERAIYLVHLGDWLSYFLAELKGIDATEVNVIDFLKSELSKS